MKTTASTSPSATRLTAQNAARSERHPSTRRTSRFFGLAAIAATALSLGVAGKASAQAAKTWLTNPAANSGNWSQVTNWGGTAPTNTDRLVFTNSTLYTLTNDISNLVLSGITFSAGAGNYVISGNDFTLAGGLTNNSTVGSMTISNNITLTNTWNLFMASSSGNVTFAGNLSGNGTVTQTGGGGGAETVSFAGNNSGFTGSFTQDNSGNNRTAFNTANSGSANAAWSFNRSVNGGIVTSFGVGTISFGSFSGGGWFRNNNAGTTTIRVGDLNTNSTFSGALNNSAGTFILLKAGTGTQTMSGGSSYNGGTIVQAGTLKASGNTGAFGSGTLTVATGGTADLGGLTMTVPLSLTGGTLTNGTLSNTSGNFNLGGGTVAAVLKGAAGVNQTTNTTTLTASNSYTGTTTIGGGTLVLAATNAISSSTNLVITNGGTLDIGSFNNTVGAVTLGSGTITGTGTLTGTSYTTTNGTISATLGGSATLTKNGAGTLALSAANAFSGGVNVNAGTVAFGNAAAFGTGTVTLNGGGIVNSANNFTVTNNIVVASNSQIRVLSGGNFGLNGNISGSGNIDYISDQFAANLTLGGNNSGYTGTFTQNYGVNGTRVIFSSANAGSAGATWAFNDSANSQDRVYLQFGTGTINFGALSGVQSITANNGSGGASTIRVGDLNSNSTYSAGFKEANSNTIALLKVGTGTQTMNGASAYSGGTVVSAGTLVSGNSSAFGSGTLTVSGGSADLGGKTMANALVLSSGSVANGTLSNSTGSFDLQNGTVSATLDGAAGITKSGSGTVTLTAANTLSGDTAVNGGTLKVSATNGLASSAVTVGSGATLQFDTANSTFTIGGLTLSGNAILALTQANSAVTSTGNVTVSGSSTNTISLGGLWNNTPGNYTLLNFTSFSLTDPGILALSYGGGTATLGNSFIYNNNSYALNSNATSLFLTVGSLNPTIYWSANPANSQWNTTGANWSLQADGSGSAQAFAASNDVTFGDTATNGAITAAANVSAGNISVTNSGGTVALTGPGTISGSSFLKNGSGDLNISNALSISGAVTVGGTNNTTLGPVTAISLTMNGAGTLTLAGANSYSAGQNFNSGTLALGTNNAFAGSTSLTFNASRFDLAGYNQTLAALGGTGTVTSSIGSGTLTLDNAAGTTVANTLDGGLALVKSGTGTTTLSASNSYSGGSTVNTGTLAFGTASSFGSGSITLAGGTIVNAANGVTLTNAIIVTSASGIQMLNGGNYALTGNIYGSGSITYSSTAATGDLSLGGNNSNYTGTFTAASGINGNKVTFINADAGSSAASWSFLNNSGSDRLRLNFGNGTISFGSLSGSADIRNIFTSTSNVSTIRVGDLNSNSTYYGNIGQDASTSYKTALLKVGTGTLTLGGYNQLQGGVIVDAGALNVGAGGAGGGLRTAITINSNATVNLLVGDALGYSAGNSVPLITINGGTLNNASANNNGFITSFVLNGGNVTNSGGGRFDVQSGYGITSLSNATTSVWSAPIMIRSTGNLTVSNAVGSTASGVDLVISGPVTQQNAGSTFTKTGDGTTLLSGTNTYTGTTTISGGKLIVSGLLGGGNYAGAIANSNSLIFSNSASQTLSGAISGAGSLTFAGNGTTTLGAANSYTGGTVVNGGKLVANNNTSLGSGAVTVNGGALQLNGTYTTLGNAGDGTLTVNGGSVSAGANVQLNDIYLNSGELGGAGKFMATNYAVSSGTITGRVSDGQDASYLPISANLVKYGAGTVVISGTADYTGATVVNGGTLNLAGTGTLSGSSGVTVNSSGTFAMGSGTLSVPVTVKTGGALSTLDGNGGGTARYGSLVFSDGTSISLDVIGIASDKIAADSLQGAGNLVVNLNNVSLSAGVTNTLLTWNSGWGASSYTLGSYNPLGFGLTSLNLVTNANSLGLVAVGKSISSAYWAGNLGSTWSTNNGTYGNFSTTPGVSGNATALPSAVTDVTFATGASVSNTLGQNFIIKSLNFTGVGTTTIGDDGSTLAVNSGGVNVAAGATASVQAPLTAASIANQGNLTLSNAAVSASLSNSGTFANVGSVSLGSGAVLGNTGTVANSGTVVLGDGAVLANSGSFSGAGAITGTGSVSNTGSMTLSGSNSYSGGTVQNGGTLVLGNKNALGTGTLVINAGTLDVAGLSYGFGSVVGNGGVIDNSSSNAVTLSWSNSDYSTIGSSIVQSAGAVSLEKSGSGTVNLAAINTYAGNTAVKSGTLVVSGLLGGGNYSGTITNGGTLVFSNSASQSLTGTLLGAGALSFNGSGTTTLSLASNGYTASTYSVRGGTVFLNNAMTNRAVLNDGSTLVANVSGALGGISGIQSNATVIFAGGTNSLGGYIQTGVANATQAFIVTNGATLNWLGGRFAYNGSSGTNLLINAGGNLNFTSAGSSWGMGSGGSGYYNVFSNSAGTSTFTGQVVTLGGAYNGSMSMSGFNQIINNGGQMSFANISLGNQTAANSQVAVTNQVVFGAGTTTLNQISSGYGAYTNVSNQVIFNGGTLQAGGNNGASFVNANLTSAGNGSVQVNAAGGTVDANGYTNTIAAQISGQGGLTFTNSTGAGIMTLSGSNSYSGGTVVNGGTLVASNASALGAGALTVNAGKVQNNGQSVSLTDLHLYGGEIAGSGSFQATNYDVTSGTISGRVSDGKDLAGNGVAANLVKSGSGTVVISGTADYTGSTVVNGGTLNVTGLLTNSSGVTVNSAGTFAIGSGTLNTTVTVNGGTLSTQNGVNGGILSISNLVFSGTSTIGLDADRTGSDQIAAGSLTVGDGLTINLNNGLLNVGSTKTLLSWTNADVVPVASLVSLNPLGFGITSLSLITNANSIDLAVNGNVINTAYWIGDQGSSWTNNNSVVGNFATNSGATAGNANALPSAVTDVFFNQTTSSTSTVGQNLAINSLNFTGTGTATIGNDGSTLTVGAGGLNVGAGSAANVGVAIAGTAGVTNNGALTLSGSNSYTGGTVLNGGTLTLGANNTLAGTGTVTVNAGQLDLAGYNQTLASLNGSGTVTSSTGSASLTLSNAAGTSVANTLNGALALVKSGSGTTTLTVSNGYTGGTVINGGVLSLGNAGALGTAGSIAFGGGQLQFSSANAGDYSSRFSTASNQAYSFDLAGQNVSFASALTSSNGSLAIANTTGSATLTLNGVNTYTGGTTIGSNSTLVLSASTLLGNGNYNGSIANNGAFLVNNGAVNQTLGGVISGSGSLTLSGSGTTTLAALNTYTGGTVVNSGVLNLNAGSSAVGVIRGSLTINSGAQVNLLSWNALGYNGGVAVDNIIINGGTLDNVINTGATGQGFLQNITMTGGTVMASGGGAYNFNGTGVSTLASSNTATFSAPITLRGNNTTFNVASGTTTNGVDLLVSGQIGQVQQGNGAIVKSGSGNLLLTASNSNIGGVTVNGGQLTLGNAQALGTGALRVAGGTVQFSGYSVTNALAISSGILNNGTAGSTVALASDATVTGDFSLNGPGSFSLQRLIAANSPRTVTVNGTGTVTTAGQGHNNLMAWTINSGTVNFATASTNGSAAYAADRGVTVNGGTLLLSGTNQNLINDDQSFAMNGGTFNLNGHSEAVGGLLGTNPGSATAVVINDAPSTTGLFSIGGGNQSASFSGAIRDGSGVISVAKVGTGTQTLSGVNTYSGGTAISGGVLAVTTTQSIGSGDVSFSGGNLSYSGTADSTFTNNFTVASNSTGVIENKSAGNVLTLSGNLTKSESVLTLAGGAINVTGAITGSTTNFTSDLVVSNAQVTLGQAASYYGPTRVVAGSTLTAGAQEVLPSTTVLHVGSVSDLAAAVNKVDLNGNTQTLAGLVSEGSGQNIVINSSKLVRSDLNIVGSSEFGGTLAGNLNVNAAYDTLKLTGTNTYTGATTVDSGTLNLGQTGKLLSTESVNLTGSTLLVAGNDQINHAADLHLDGSSVVLGDDLQKGSLTVGNLTLTGNSVIDFTSLSGSNFFGFTSMTFETGAHLNVYNYTPGLTSLLDNSNGLNTVNLSNISFYSGGIGSSLTTGEIVPVPEPGVMVAGMMLIGLFLVANRHTLVRMARRIA